MFNRKPIALALTLAAAGTTLVIACGPDFPAQLLDDRQATLYSTPANSFAYEATHLLPSTVGVKADGPYWRAQDAQPDIDIPEDYDPTLSVKAREQIRAIRKLTDGDLAYAAGSSLDEATRLYTAGAVDYRGATEKDSDTLLDRAIQRFQAVLNLPGREGDPRAIWAAYMLAEIGGAPAEHDTADTIRQRAAKAYQAVRERAAKGGNDEQGLAVASLGQEARLYLTGESGPCAYEDFMNGTACASSIPTADLKQAIHLYAQQAASGSSSGVASLRLLADWALSDRARAQQLIDDPVAQRLLVAYALARIGDIVDGNPDSAYDYDANFSASGQRGLADNARGAKNVQPNPALQSLVLALQKQDVSKIDGVDRVAALAYRIGRYDLAQSLSEKLDTSLAWWVRAKLALRQGNVERAAEAYSHAVRNFPRNDTSVDTGNLSLMKAEQGVLTLSRGQYIEALDQLFTASTVPVPEAGWLLAPYWNDAAYVAERVLSTDELKTYVDAHVPATSVPTVPEGFTQFDSEKYYEWANAHQVPSGERLRQLLARRLVRDGKIDQALPYFPADLDPRFAQTSYDENKFNIVMPQSRQRATDYGEALRVAASAWWRTTRAEAAYNASRIARRYGMEIMGYEQSPDYAVYDGGYTYGAGRGPEPWQTFGAAVSVPDTPEARAAQALPAPFVTPDERLRYAASEARPFARFHYREIATDHAIQASNELPPRSQAFAAVLCHGARYIIDDDPARASQVYLRYVQRGAYLPFGNTFGRTCAEPDFKEAAWFYQTQAWSKWERFVHQHRARLQVGAGLIAALVAAAAFLWVRRRRVK